MKCRRGPDELAKLIGELRALGEVGRAVNSTLYLETVLTVIVAKVGFSAGSPAGFLRALSISWRHLRPVGAGNPERSASAGYRLLASEETKRRVTDFLAGASVSVMRIAEKTMLLKYKTVMLTGGASGIGRATVLMLAAEGARILLCDMNQAGAEETIKMAEGSGIEFIKLELTDGATIDACTKEALDRTGGKIDVLINVAGWDRTQPFVEATQEFIDKVMGINLVGPVRLTRAVFPAMIQAGGGKIVFVASDAGRVGSLGETPYSAAKGGIIGFTKSLAREGARHRVTVNCVCPGPTDTPLFHANPERMRDALLRAIPFRRLAKPEDIAGAILYFAGPTSDYVTGQLLSVSGGLTMAG